MGGACGRWPPNRRGRLGYRFVEEASRTPLQPAGNCETERCWHWRAAVGLDEHAGALAEVETLSCWPGWMIGPSATSRRWTWQPRLSAWDGLSGSAAVRVARQLTLALKDTKDLIVLSMRWAQGTFSGGGPPGTQGRHGTVAASPRPSHEGQQGLLCLAFSGQRRGFVGGGGPSGTQGRRGSSRGGRPLLSRP